PARAAEEEVVGRHALSRSKEEFLHTRLAVRQTVAEKGKMRLVTGLRLHGKMRLWIERIIDRHAFPGSKRPEAVNDRVAAPIGKDQIRDAQILMQGMIRLKSKLRQRRRGIHIPIDPQGSGPGMAESAPAQAVVLKSYA